MIMWPFNKKTRRQTEREAQLEKIIANHELHIQNLVRSAVGQSRLISALGVDTLIMEINRDNRIVFYEVSKL